MFVSNGVDGQPTQGLCLVCARELGIKPVNDIMEKMGITDEELEAATAQMTELMNLNNDNDEEEDLFAPGGAATLPVDQMLGGRPGENGGYGGAGVQQKKESFHKKKRKHIQNFCTDLTGKARNGELDNIIGREKEIQRVVQILSRRTKNNPCLIGEPGVGKTAIAEGLA
ncbi:MAG TPA: ATP-dependent Clp protease ATP-binding subunit, partial [Candidatus Acutalibacter stercoravium]|nr:ATP-dependent Clp protease ATP-binding subunit [Candidatus Acutalibacter stercoravium]